MKTGNDVGDLGLEQIGYEADGSKGYSKSQQAHAFTLETVTFREDGRHGISEE